MAATNYTPIQLFRTTTAAATPSAGSLADGELAINLTDEKLYFKNAAGVVKLLASNTGALGTVTSVALSGGTTGLTVSGSPITSSGTITLGGTLNVANGGTGASSLTSGYLVKGNGTAAASASVVYDDGTNVGIGTSSPQKKLAVSDGGNIGFEVSPNDAAQGYTRLLNYNRATSQYAPVRYEGSTQTWFVGTAGTTRAMDIDSSGNVGIGISSPGATNKLEVSGNAGLTWAGDSKFWMNFSNDYRMGMRLDSNSRSTTIFATTATAGDGGYIAFNTRAGAGSSATDYGSEKMRLDASGNVGIGTTSPTVKLHVVDTTGSAFAANISSNTGGNTTLRMANTATGGGVLDVATGASGHFLFGFGAIPLVFGTDGAERARIDSSGNLAIGSTTAASTSGKNITIGGIEPSLVLNSSGGSRSFSIASGGNFQYTPSALCFVDNTAGVTRMLIDSSGNLLVGTTTSTSGRRLDVQGGNVFLLSNLGVNSYGSWLENANTAVWAIRATGTKNACLSFTEAGVADRWAVGTKGGDGSLIFASGSTDIATGTERARIDSSGNLLVGTTSGINGSINRVQILNADGGVGGMTIGNSTGSSATTAINFVNSNGFVGSITTSGSATTYNTSSDARLKENIADADSASNLIDQIKVRKYDWKSDGSHQRYGFIAQELLPVAPEAVSQPEDPDAMMGVDYSKLVPMLVKEIQDLRARVAQLEGAA